MLSHYHNSSAQFRFIHEREWNIYDCFHDTGDSKRCYTTAVGISTNCIHKNKHCKGQHARCDEHLRFIDVLDED